MSAFITAPIPDPQRGFLPSPDPLPHLPPAFDAWESVALSLPKLFASDHLRRTLHQLPPFPLEAITNEPERERAMTLLSYLGHAYVWGGPKPTGLLIKELAVPWYAVAQSLGRPPVLSYSSYALHNFVRFDPNRDIECGNIGLIQNFLGGIDYPVGKLDLLKKARENGASQDVMNILERIADKEYTNPAEVTKEAANAR